MPIMLSWLLSQHMTVLLNKTHTHKKKLQFFPDSSPEKSGVAI
jgi:hypothetical protein